MLPKIYILIMILVILISGCIKQVPEETKTDAEIKYKDINENIYACRDWFDNNVTGYPHIVCYDNSGKQLFDEEVFTTSEKGYDFLSNLGFSEEENDILLSLKAEVSQW
jgi:hypothetical protein